MNEITVKLRIPEEILKHINLEKIAEKVKDEIMLEYNLKMLHGKFKGKNLIKLLEEVENEWGV